MKKVFSILVVITLITSQIFAQKVSVDKKTGLVTVDGKESFYLTEKNKSFMQTDYALENLNHEELAYLKYEEVVWYSHRGNKSTSDYLMVFTKSGNQCYITNFNILTGIIKPIAKDIAAANLVQNGAISEAEERKFIVLHDGEIIKDATPIQPERTIVVSNATQAPINAEISLKDNKIYSNSELVGVFKRITEDSISTISVYNGNDVLVCKASHEDGNENADWNIQYDGKNSTILFNTAAPLEKLFKYLVEKGIL